MSCDTWVYLKKEDYSSDMIESHKKKAINNLKNNYILNHDYSEWKIRMKNILRGTDEYDCSTMISKELYEKRRLEYIDNLNKLENDTYIFDKLMTDSGEVIIEYNNEKYYSFDYNDKLYRVTDSPDIIIDSKDLFINYALENKTAYVLDSNDTIITAQDGSIFIETIKNIADTLYSKYPNCILDMG